MKLPALKLAYVVYTCMNEIKLNTEINPEIKSNTEINPKLIWAQKLTQKLNLTPKLTQKLNVTHKLTQKLNLTQKLTPKLNLTQKLTQILNLAPKLTMIYNQNHTNSSHTKCAHLKHLKPPISRPETHLTLVRHTGVESIVKSIAFESYVFGNAVVKGVFCQVIAVEFPRQIWVPNVIYLRYSREHWFGGVVLIWWLFARAGCSHHLRNEIKWKLVLGKTSLIVFWTVVSQCLVWNQTTSSKMLLLDINLISYIIVIVLNLCGNILYNLFYC